MKKKYYGKRKAFLRRVMSVCIAVFVLENPLSVSADVIFEPDCPHWRSPRRPDSHREPLPSDIHSDSETPLSAETHLTVHS